MCESEVNQDILSRTDFCFIRTEFYLFSGAYKWEFYRFSQEPYAFHSSGLAKKVFSDDMSGLEPVVFPEKGARVMLTMNLLSTAYRDSC